MQTLYSRICKTHDRRYFFDVYERDTGLCLTVKESRLSYGRRITQTLQIWECDLPAFTLAFLESLWLFDSEELQRTVLAIRRSDPRREEEEGKGN